MTLSRRQALLGGVSLVTGVVIVVVLTNGDSDQPSTTAAIATTPETSTPEDVPPVSPPGAPAPEVPAPPDDGPPLPEEGDKIPVYGPNGKAVRCPDGRLLKLTLGHEPKPDFEVRGEEGVTYRCGPDGKPVAVPFPGPD